MTTNRIAIFGDSFSDPTWADNDYSSWVDLLCQDYNITNFSKSGTSLWWSYNQLNENPNYDLSIFVVTASSRIYFEPMDIHININQSNWPTFKNVNLGEAYYRYMFSQKREDDFHQLMVNDLMSRSNVLVIPAFEDSIQNIKGSMCVFSDMEELYFFNGKKVNAQEHRKCHLTKENNEVVYENVKNAIVNNKNLVTFSKEEFVFPKGHWSKYWRHYA